jgi:phosphoribosylanthranilate isomerase
MIAESSKSDLQAAGRPLKIKVCGLTRPSNVEEISSLQPDFAGFIFYPGSRRYVGDHPDPALFRIPAEGTARVGVFVNEPVSRVRRLFESCLLDLVQLHGSEPVAYCRELIDAGIPVIRAIHAGYQSSDGSQEGDRKGALDLEQLDRFCGAAHYLLFDSGKSGTGGSGKPFDWHLLDDLNVPLPFLLGGGIGPDDADRIREFPHPSLFGVDLNSRFETSPGIKDAELLGIFMERLREPYKRNETWSEK